MKMPESRMLFLPQAAQIGDRRSFSSAMSTDTDDETGSVNGVLSRLSSHEATPSSPSSAAAGAAESASSSLSTVLITANVGSIFEEPEKLIPNWHEEITGYLENSKPKFVAIHFQEVGGKNINEGMIDLVEGFVRDLVSKADELGYTRHVVLFDQNYKPEKFTALGCLYLVHESVQRVALYDFETREFSPFSNSHFHIGCIDSTTGEDSGPSIVEKQKFPLKYFPESRWSRKGYLRTRWSLNGTQFDLINIHLFHDASNLVSVEEVPSIYCNFRRRALQYTLDKIQTDEHQSLPLFIFGDFNFRLEGKSVLTKLTRGLSRQCSETPDQNSDYVQFLNDEDQLVLSIGKKEFTLEKEHDETFQNAWNQWTKYDQEKETIAERLSEVPLNFPPTYPFEEDPDAGSKYMRTRCPAWCDRVLFSHPTRQIMEGNGPDSSCYDIIGRTVCMGDHKPVFLQFRLRPDVSNLPIPSYRNSSNSNSPVSGGEDNANNYHQKQRRDGGGRGGGGDGGGSNNRPSDSPTKCPRVESPNYTDLLNNDCNNGGMTDLDQNAGSPCTRYIEIKDVNSVKLFKETTV